MRRPWTVVSGVVAALVISLAAPAVARAADTPPWTLGTLPTPRFGSGVVYDVACGAADSCMAMGLDNGPVTPTSMFAQHFDGTSWTLTPLPRFDADGSGVVSCPAADACLAIFPTSSSHPTALRWDGSAWTLFAPAIPAVTGVVRSVACLTMSDCTAVGTTRSGDVLLPWVLHWDGSRWTTRTVNLASPNPDTIVNDVACASSGVCFAVGHSGDRQLLLAGNGQQWRPVKVPVPAGGSAVGELDGVACPSATACFAVGASLKRSGPYSARLLGWDGTTWTVQPTPDPELDGPFQLSGSALRDIACTGPTACVAVGGDEPGFADTAVSYAQRWDGSTWTVSRFATPATGSDFIVRHLDCRGATCVTVGNHGGAPPDGLLPLSEVGDGLTWQTIDMRVRLQPPVTPLMAGVSCATDTSCLAVGDYAPTGGRTQPLLQRWNGTRWTMEASPIADPTRRPLADVSCTAPRSCMVLGTGTNHIDRAPTAAHLDGTTWTTSRVVVPPGDTDDGLTLVAVSCASARLCFAAGSASPQPVLERWTPADGWSLVPHPASSQRGEFRDVSCAGPTWCVAVGSATVNGGSVYHGLLEVFDGTGWQRVTVPLPAGDKTDALAAVSCSSPGHCAAVGSSAHGSTGRSTAYEIDGTDVVLPPQPTGSHGFSDVSCRSDDACVALGTGTPYTQSYDGTAWTADTTAPPTATYSRIACRALCQAVGGFSRYAASRPAS